MTAALLLAGCAGVRPGAASNTVTTLYFGLSKPDGGQVTDAEWRVFVDDDVARLFPDGFTVLSGEGGWRDHDRTIHEPSRVVIIVHANADAIDTAIEQLRATYCRRFGQESVLRVDEAAARVSF